MPITSGPTTLSRDTPDLIVFDSDCIICSGFARFVAKHDRTARFRFVSAASTLGRRHYAALGLDPDLMETNIVIIDGRAHLKMASFTAVMGVLGWPWRLLTALRILPRPVADWLYDRVARNRYRIGRRACPLPSEDLLGRLVE